MNSNVKSKLKIVLGIIILLGVSFGGYNYYQGKQEAKKATAVETVTAERMDLKSTVSATGTIRPVDAVEVSSKITARVKSVLVKENDTVKAGQTVAILDGKDYEAKEEQARYKVNNTKSKYSRMKYLHSIGAKSDEDMEDAQYNYETAESSLSETESHLAETVITAPMDGIVVGEPLTAGSKAVQGNSNPTVIMRIADLSKKQIMAKVDETDIGQIKVGQSATFTVDSYTGKTFTAKVSKISQTDVSNSWYTSGTSSSTSSSSSASVIYYYVTLDVDDPEGVLLPAMTARVEINTSDKPNALAIPISALTTKNSDTYVTVLNQDGTTEERKVSTGIYSDEYVEILDGLSEGEKVTVSYKASSSSSSSNNQRQGGPPPM